jgi:hypothetical protein
VVRGVFKVGPLWVDSDGRKDVNGWSWGFLAWWLVYSTAWNRELKQRRRYFFTVSTLGMELQQYYFVRSRSS